MARIRRCTGTFTRTARRPGTATPPRWTVTEVQFGEVRRRDQVPSHWRQLAVPFSEDGGELFLEVVLQQQRGLRAHGPQPSQGHGVVSRVALPARPSPGRTSIRTVSRCTAESNAGCSNLASFTAGGVHGRSVPAAATPAQHSHLPRRPILASSPTGAQRRRYLRAGPCRGCGLIQADSSSGTAA